MTKVQVELEDNSYSIEIAEQLLSSGKISQLLPISNQYAIITNEKVASYYLTELKLHLPSHATITVCLIPDSEQSKSQEQYFKIMDLLLSKQFSRSSTIIALGGGVVGDLAGFVAATLHRGCKLVQIPTTLLAQVDSSVGGKTAINHPTGKNLIGSFYQPNAVFIDPVSLLSLEPRQFAAGMAEVIKYGFILDKTFLSWLEVNAKAIQDYEMITLEAMISRCCSIKAKIVAADEKELGQRVLLNFGHTFGHAIENISGYGKWLHGEAIAVGMLMASKLAVDNKLMQQELYNRLFEMLTYFKLPTTISEQFSARELLSCMYRDKKNLANDLQLVLPRDVGHTELTAWEDDSSLLSLMQSFGAAE